MKETDSTSNKDIVAMFATRGFAKEAQEKLLLAGFNQVLIDVNVTPDQIEAVSEVTPASTTLPNVMPGAMQTTPLTPAVIETLEANATARLTLQSPENRVAEAISIIKQASGQIPDEIRLDHQL